MRSQNLFTKFVLFVSFFLLVSIFIVLPIYTSHTPVLPNPGSDAATTEPLSVIASRYLLQKISYIGIGGNDYYDEYHCGCPRYGPKVNEFEDQSLCSSWATSRGHGQKVVSYTVYGDVGTNRTRRLYFDQIEYRIKEVNHLYPGWIVRLHHNENLDDNYIRDIFCSLYCKYPNFDPCRIENLRVPKTWNALVVPYDSKKLNNTLSMHFLEELPNISSKNTNSEEKLLPLKSKSKSTNGKLGDRFSDRLSRMMWRVIPLGDPLVSKFLSRDLDASILPREAAVVNQWLENSTAVFHVMRDHPHHTRAILGGLWGGARDRKGGSALTVVLQGLLRFPKIEKYNYDQTLLKIDTWPKIRDNVMVHDSYHCNTPKLIGVNASLPFPIRRELNFLYTGSGPKRKLKLSSKIPHCPVKCRPKDHKDWFHC